MELDEIWWLVTPANPLKDPTNYANYQQRCYQAAAVANHASIKISDFEKTHSFTYTIDTITALKKAYPEYQLVWLMGADSLESFHQWQDWKKIFDLVPIAVMNRPGHEQAPDNAIAAKTFSASRVSPNEASNLPATASPAWVFIPGTNNQISSTKIRAGSTSGKIDMDTVPPNISHKLSHFLDFDPPRSNFYEDAVAGLSKPQKSLSPKYFYDEHGSEIFNQITQTKDYYPTRTELALMREHLADIRRAIGANPAIFEYGSGASEKIRLLIENLNDLKTYVAMDISRDYLLDSAQTIAANYPNLSVSAVCADFQQAIILPKEFHPEVKNWTGYFPGSTIGNFAPDTVKSFFTRISNTLGAGSKFLLGFDLIKDPAILNRAYNDDEGITAAFNLNLLHRMRRELGAELNVEDFEHHAFYNETENRIEMHLRALHDTKITIQTHSFPFQKGETLHTEFSYKFTRAIMESMLEGTPWTLTNYWTDDKGWFGTCLLCNNS